MIHPIQTTFRNCDRSEAVVARIEEESGKLEKYFDRITSCRVMVEPAHKHQRRGEPFHVRIELGVPGKELVVSHEPTARLSGRDEDAPDGRRRAPAGQDHKDVYIAIRDAFRAMRRELQDYVSHHRPATGSAVTA